MKTWRWDFGDVVEVDEGESMPWIRLKHRDGSLILEPVKVDAVPLPGGRFTFAGTEYRLSDEPPAVAREHLDVGTFDGFEAEVITLIVVSATAVKPVPHQPAKAPAPQAFRRFCQ